MADEQQTMIGEADQRAAVAVLRAAAATGELTEDDAARRVAAVWKAVTPRDLWKATGGRAGSPKRADTRERRRAATVVVAMIVFAVVAWGVIVLLLSAIEDSGAAG